MTRDAYDEMVAFLTDNPKEIHNAWNYPEGHIAGGLFTEINYGKQSACLTQLKLRFSFDKNEYVYDPGDHPLVELIRMDDHIPDTGTKITPEILPVFAEWRRRIDTELRLQPSVWKGIDNDTRTDS